MFVAYALRDAGVGVLRSGAWKPRTKPGGFEGYGERALPWIVRAARSCGMLSATEVATAAHVHAALEAGIDILWIGARTTANPFAVQEIADTLQAAGSHMPVLVKNPVSPDTELWIGALERLHRRLPELPLLCDPSHIAGRSEIVGDVSQQAMDLCFDGLMVEVHCCPDSALSDARQQLTPQAFTDMLGSLKLRHNPQAPSTNLDALREEIDRIDDRLLATLARRMAVSDEIGRYKLREGIPVVQPHRYKDLIDKRCAQAAEAGLNPDFVRAVLAAIHEESVRRQLSIIN